MAKKTTQKPEVRSQESKVWHITDFDEIFKLGDDARKGRKGPLSYTKSFVSLSGTSKPCEVHHCERLKDLKSRPQRHLLRSVFEDLKSWAAHKPQRYQGFLVTHAGRPADPDYIAAQIDYIDKQELKKAMMILNQIGLIERVTVNGQFSADIEDSPDSSRKGREGSGNDADSLLNDKAEGKDQAAPDKRKASGDKTTFVAEGKENGNGREKALKSPSHPKPSADKPCESDLGGESAKAGSNPPGAAFNAASSRQRAKPVHHKGDYEKCDITYGTRIFKNLGLSKNENRESRSFASKAHECRCKLYGLPPPEIDKILDRGLRQAEKIARQKNCNKAKVWNRFMDDITNKKLSSSG